MISFSQLDITVTEDVVRITSYDQENDCHYGPEMSIVQWRAVRDAIDGLLSDMRNKRED